MNKDSPYDVFVSHSLKDEKWVYDLAQFLKNNGLRVFVFEKEIKIGESIPRKINKVLEECNCVIFVMTQDWLESEWSTHEAYSSLFDDPNNRKQRIIPILLKKFNIPITLKTLKYIDFTNEEKLSDNLKILRSTLVDLIQNNFNIKIHSLQCEQILKQSMLPWTKRGELSVGFVIPELYIETKVKAIKNPIASIEISKWLSGYLWNQNIAVVGLPGIGKSTLLRKIFIDFKIFKEYLKLEYTPIFASIRDLIDFQGSSFDNFSEYIFSKFNEVPIENPNHKNLIFIDGLDEIEVTKCESIIKTILNIKSKNDLLWVSSRIDFFYTRLNSNSQFSDLFYDVLEIQEWDVEIDSLRFAEEYSKKYQDPNLLSRLIKLRYNSPNINNFLRKPFELTLILFLLSKDKRYDEKSFDSSYALYKSFYENWLEREQHKGTSKLTVDNIRNLHQNVAISLFQNRGNGVSLNSIDLNKLNIILTFENIKSDSSFWDLLITNSNNEEIIIERFWHETFGEFIIAEQLIQTFSSGTQSFIENLKTIYNNEINSFLREGFQQLHANQKFFIYERLANAYFEIFSTEMIFSNDSINITIINSLTIDKKIINNEEYSVRIREQILYYLGRLELNFYPPILSFAAKFEDNQLLKRSAMLGGILYGNEEMERDYLLSLIYGTKEDIINRSVQLVYFGDVYGDLHSFKDNDVFAWEKTRNAILKRLTQNTKRDIALRWWDLRTLFTFLESRKWKDRISELELKVIENCNFKSDLYSISRGEYLSKEIENIITMLIKNHCIY